MNTFIPKWAIPALALITLAAATLPASAYSSAGIGTMTAAGTTGTKSGPALSGTITAIDPAAATITVTSTTGTATTVRLTTATLLTGLQTTSAANIAIGDRLDLTGIPVTIQAATILVDHSAAATEPTATTANTTTATDTPSALAGTSVPGTLNFSAVVTALSPPTVKLDNGLSLTLSPTSNPAYTERVTLTASQLAVGQTASVSFAPDSTTLIASGVEVTATGS